MNNTNKPGAVEFPSRFFEGYVPPSRVFCEREWIEALFVDDEVSEQDDFDTCVDAYAFQLWNDEYAFQLWNGVYAFQLWNEG